jgi:hypothetical protein
VRRHRWMMAAPAAAILGISVLVVLAVRIAPISGAASPPVAYGFGGGSGWQGGQVRPHAIAFGAGGSLFVRQVTWSIWKSGVARGRGVVWVNDCSPSCAQGSYTESMATLSLSAARTHDGHAYFAKLVMTWSQDGRLQSDTYRWSTSPGGTLPFWH